MRRGMQSGSRIPRQPYPTTSWTIKADIACQRRTADDRFAGNGGLSLRRVSAIKRVLKFQVRQNDTQPEDEWFGTRLWVLKGERVASAADGGLAVEDTYWEKPMGFHVRDGGAHLSDAVWRNHKQRREIFDYCPELALIMDMKLERERCPGDDKEGVIHPTEEELRKQAEEAQRKKEEEERKKKEEQRKKDEEMRLKAEADELSRKVMEDEERRFMESQHAATATAETAETAAAETAAPAPTAASSDEDTVTAQADAEPKPTMAAVSEAVAAGSASAMPPVVMPVHTGDPTNQPHPAETPQPEPSQPAANVNGDADQ